MENVLRKRLAQMGRREDAILASRATVALTAVLRALKLPTGSEVLLPATLCANAALAVRLAGLRPLFADVSSHDLNLDLTAARKAVGPATRVLIAVPLFGHPLNTGTLHAFAEEKGLMLIEDAAHAVGLHHDTQPAGSLGFCSVFSFGRGKIADAGGGAAVLGPGTFLRKVQAELEQIQKHGRYDEQRILLALDRLPEELEMREAGVRRYNERLNLSNSAYITHLAPTTAGNPLWLYSVLFPDRQARDRATSSLLARGLAATNLYPPLPLFFREAGGAGISNYPVAWNAFQRIVNLPLPSRSEEWSAFVGRL